MDAFISQRKHERKTAGIVPFEDKFRDDLVSERYLHEMAREMVTNMMALTGNNSIKSVIDGINTSMELQLGHFLLLRGDDKRLLGLADSMYTIQQTGRGEIPILSFLLIKSEAVGEGKARCMGACRGKDVEVCLISAFAFMQWFRFDFPNGPLSGDNLPDFLDKTDWYRTKVLFSSQQNPQKRRKTGIEADTPSPRRTPKISDNEICSTYENKLMQLCFDSIDANSAKTAPASRKADSHQVPEHQIERAGHWSHSALVKHDRQPFAFDFIHFAAGFDTHEPYFIARDIDPPAELEKEIFPWLEGVIKKVEERGDQSHLDKSESDRAAGHYLQMLKKFRRIILQDLAVLMEKSSRSIFCTHDYTKKIRENPRFIEFRTRMKTHLSQTSLFPVLEDAAARFASACPDIYIAMMQMKAGITETHHKMLHEIKQHEYSLSGLNDFLVLKNQQYEDQERRLAKAESRQLMFEEKVDRSLRTMAQNIKILVDNLQCAASAHPSREVHVAGSQQENTNELDEAYSNGNPGANCDPKDPQFDLIRVQLQSCADIWREWHFPIDDRDSIEKRNRIYRTQWRTDKESKYRKKKAVVEIVKDMKEKYPEARIEELLELLENYKDTSMYRTLPKLIEDLRKKKARKDVFKALCEKWENLTTQGTGGKT